MQSLYYAPNYIARRKFRSDHWLSLRVDRWRQFRAGEKRLNISDRLAIGSFWKFRAPRKKRNPRYQESSLYTSPLSSDPVTSASVRYNIVLKCSHGTDQTAVIILSTTRIEYTRTEKRLYGRRTCVTSAWYIWKTNNLNEFHQKKKKK